MTSTDSPLESRVVEILKEPVELFKVLKFEGLAASGGAAKTAIAAGLVAVNGSVELRKRRQIHAGDSIVFAGVELRVQPLSAEENSE